MRKSTADAGEVYNCMKKQIGIYSGLHFLVDFLCAASMFGSFIKSGQGYLWIIIYNFCAFALQMPLGIILDSVDDRHMKRSVAQYTMFAGVLLTVLGTFFNPVILGLGNAMFHIGGGVGTVREDAAGNYRGAGLGVFVAPGALGLYTGTLLSKGGWSVYCRTTGIVAAGILIWVLICDGYESRKIPLQTGKDERCFRGESFYLLPKHLEGVASGRNCRWLLCFLVVILRSYVGMAVIFPWKTTLSAGMFCTLAVVMGKVSGGFLAAKVGIKKAASSSLVFAAILYLLSDIEAAGILALFFFNMSMPMTLYLLVKKYPQAAGFSFGLLTFALFLGFLPIYLEVGNISDGRLIGCAGSVISLVLLALAEKS